MPPVTAVVIGCGGRGRCYSEYALLYPDELRIVAAADPSPSARSYMTRTFGLDEASVFGDWRELVGRGRLADAALICTQDRLHYEPCTACKRLGYHVLLEKPMSEEPLHCLRLARDDWLSRDDQLLAVCHVLRHLPAVRKLHELLRSGLIGRLLHAQHTEPVGHVHFAHSYVRGNWRSEQSSAFALLTKCCHDVDLLCYWMPSACARVSSFGKLSYFTSDNKPQGAASRCTDCALERECPYSAIRAYLDPGLFSSRAVCDPELAVGNQKEYREKLLEALRTGPYGRCVYDCDNNVCDHQVVNFEFADGATATLAMIACTEAMCVRSTTFYGSKGELTWNGQSYGDTAIQHYDFLKLSRRHIPVEVPPMPTTGRMGGHGSADFFLMQHFVRALLHGGEAKSKLQAELEASTLPGHLVTFAAEESRRSNRVVEVQEFVQRLQADA